MNNFIKNVLSKLNEVPIFSLIITIFVLVFIIYGNAIFNGFVWDDIGQIVTNPNIQSLSNLFRFFGGSTFYSGGATSLGGIYYKPFLSIFFAFNFAIWHSNTFGFHLTNVFLHFVNVSLIFILFRKLFALEKYKYEKSIAFIISLIFLVHPVNTESISYISSLQEPLYLLFLLCALIIAISWFQSNKNANKNLFFINLLVLMSLLSKESGIVSFFLVIIFVFLFFKDRIKPILVSLSSTLFFYLILRFEVAHITLGMHSAASPIVQASFFQRLLTVPYEVFSYIRLIFFPKDLFISQHYVVKSVSDPRFYLIFPVVVVAFGVLIFVAFKLKSKLYTFFFLWFIFSLGMILNVFPLDFTIAERWLYGPLVAFLGLLGVLILKGLENNKKGAYLVISLLFLSTLPLGIRTVIRNKDWKDNMTLISHDIRLNPDSFELQGDYGTLIGNAGDLKGAKQHIEKAIELSPTWWSMYVSLGILYEKEQDFKKAEDLYLLAIKNTNNFNAYERLALIKYKTGEVKNAVDIALFGLRYYPNNPTLNFVTALSYYKLGDKVNALSYAKKTYNLYPSQQTYLAIQRITNNQSVDDLLPQ